MPVKTLSSLKNLAPISRVRLTMAIPAHIQHMRYRSPEYFNSIPVNDVVVYVVAEDPPCHGIIANSETYRYPYAA